MYLLGEFDKNLGVTINQISLGLTSQIYTLGIRFNEGFIPVRDAQGELAYLFGDGNAMLFGSETEINYGA